MSGKPVKDAIEALYKPIESIVKTLAGPAAEEIGQTFRDSIQAWRFKRQVRLFQRVKEFCEDAGITPEAVKLPFLFEVVDRASLEEDDKLQDMWAALLANAADSRNERPVISAAFPEILKELSSEEAVYLETLYRAKVISPSHWEDDLYKLPPHLRENRVPPIDRLYEDNMQRLGLVKAVDYPSKPVRFGRDSTPSDPLVRRWLLTPFGAAFVEACNAPKSSKTPG